MGHFKNNNRGGKSGRFGGGGGGRGFGGRNQDRPQMHHAVCADCGKGCEVPFKPVGNKPVYCSDCFGGNDSAPRRNFDKNKGGGRDFGRSNFGEKRMHQATCAECGNRCEVPFKPTGEKPVYCSDCFGGGGAPEPKKPGVSKEDIEALDKKLDKILRLLELIHPKREFIIEKEEAEAEPVEEKPAKKTVKKKAVAKKAPAKKATKAKKATAKKAVKKTAKKAAKK